MLVFRFSRSTGRYEISGVAGATERPRGIFRPPVDVAYRDRMFIVRMDLPGVNPEDISIEADEAEIRIVGAIPPRNPPGPCRLMERPSGTFLRTIGFPGRIAPDKVEAQLSKGVLTLTIPAPDLDRDPTRIEIRIEGAD